MKDSSALAEVNSKNHRNAVLDRVALGNFDYEKIAAHFGGKISREAIGEIFAATTNEQYGPELIDYFLRAWVKNPKRIALAYHKSYCRLLDYHFPGEEFPLYVSRVSGSVLSESWGEHRTGGLGHGIFDVAALLHGLPGKKDFPKVYAIVRETFEEALRSPRPSEAEIGEMQKVALAHLKERLLPYFAPLYSTVIRRAPSAAKLWKPLPLEIKEEEFGGSFRRFREFLLSLDLEDPTEGPFRVSASDCGNNTVFLSGKVPSENFGNRESTSQA